MDAPVTTRAGMRGVKESGAGRVRRLWVGPGPYSHCRGAVRPLGGDAGPSTSLHRLGTVWPLR